jgi:peptide/nickel transport system substrate-binding protein
MQKKFIWLGLSLILVVALVLSSLISSCGTKTTTTTTSVKTTTTTPAGPTPITGGTFTYYLWGGEVTDADMTDAYWPTVEYTAPILEYLIRGDFEKYGPRGTNQSDFTTEQIVPEAFAVGTVISSWNVTAQSITLNVKHGVMWPANSNINFASREYKASDTAFSLNRFVNSQAGGNGLALTSKGGWIDSITASGDYTCVIKTSTFHADWIADLATTYGSAQYAPETVAAGPTKWENIVGTGPFEYSEHVAGSYMSYVKNPVYHEKATIGGKQYTIPFIDKLVYPIVADNNTLIANLRTGKIDCCQGISLQYESSLATSTPDLVKHTWLHSINLVMGLNLNNKPLDNVKVRQALMMALDLKGINTTINIKGDYTTFPVDGQSSPGIFTPIAQLPAADAALFTYDPVKAKQMMTDAGFANGFPMSIAIRAGEPSTSSFTDAAQLMADQWKKNLNVTLTLNPLETVAFTNMMNSHTGYDATTQTILHTDALKVLSNLCDPKQPSDDANFNDAAFTAKFNEAASTVDTAARNAILKDLCVQLIDSVAYIPIGATDFNTYWWPWVKNYYGEYDTAAYCPAYWQAELWIDQAAKTALGH